MSQSRLTGPSSRLLLLFCINMPREQLVPWQPGKEQVFRAKQQKPTNEKNKASPGLRLCVSRAHSYAHNSSNKYKMMANKSYTCWGFNSEKWAFLDESCERIQHSMANHGCYKISRSLLPNLQRIEFSISLKTALHKQSQGGQKCFQALCVCECVCLCKCLLCTWVHTFLSGCSWDFPWTLWHSAARQQSGKGVRAPRGSQGHGRTWSSMTEVRNHHPGQRATRWFAHRSSPHGSDVSNV